MTPPPPQVITRNQTPNEKGLTAFNLCIRNLQIHFCCYCEILVEKSFKTKYNINIINQFCKRKKAL